MTIQTYFSNFSTKHMLWPLIRTISARRFYIYFKGVIHIIPKLSLLPLLIWSTGLSIRPSPMMIVHTKNGVPISLKLSLKGKNLLLCGANCFFSEKL